MEFSEREYKRGKRTGLKVPHINWEIFTIELKRNIALRTKGMVGK